MPLSRFGRSLESSPSPLNLRHSAPAELHVGLQLCETLFGVQRNGWDAVPHRPVCCQITAPADRPPACSWCFNREQRFQKASSVSEYHSFNAPPLPSFHLPCFSTRLAWPDRSADHSLTSTLTSWPARITTMPASSTAASVALQQSRLITASQAPPPPRRLQR
jgi:hypothetical protein